jgi:aminotransferase
MCHAVPVIIDSPERSDLSFDVADIEKAITPKTRAIMINTPSNPSGRIIPQDKIAGIAELAKKYDLVVISDEVYKCLLYDNVPFKSIVAIEGMRERTILINSLSKEFCMTGYRIGYVLAPEEIIAAMTKLQENVAACAPLPSQYAAIKALSGEENYSKNMVDIFTERRNVLYEGLRKIEKFSVKAPEATFYMMVDISKTGMNSIDFCYALLRQVHVAAVPGVTYGQCCDHYIRIAFTLDVDKIKEGVRRITEFANTL